MPRLLHLADVHLGARHHDLGAAAVEQRERQFAAFERAIDLALSERVDLVLVAGDLFDSNQQPTRSVERAAAQFRRLLPAGICSVIIPGTHDVYDRSSIYRTYDLPALAGAQPGSNQVVVLTPERPDVVFQALDLVVYGRVFATKRAPHSPLAGFDAATDTRAHWKVGLIHGSLRIAGKVEQDEVLFTGEEVAASGLQYLALGHWHSFSKGTLGATTWAYAGAPEPVAVDQDGAGQVLLVDLLATAGGPQVRVEPRAVGRTRFQRLDVDAGELTGQQALVDRLRALADPDLVLDCRLTGVEPEAFDLDEDEVLRQAGPGFLRLRLANAAVAALPDGPLPPADTIAGAFIRDLEARIAEEEAADRTEQALELREALRLGRVLLDDPTRVTLA
jgi:DNA repair exonuclease SbcCD nuclease subunit